MASSISLYITPIEFCGLTRRYLHELVVGEFYYVRGRRSEWSVRITERDATRIVVLLSGVATRRLHDRVSPYYTPDPEDYRTLNISAIDQLVDQDDPTDTQQFYHFYQHASTSDSAGAWENL